MCNVFDPKHVEDALRRAFLGADVWKVHRRLPESIVKQDSGRLDKLLDVVIEYPRSPLSPSWVTSEWLVVLEESDEVDEEDRWRYRILMHGDSRALLLTMTPSASLVCVCEATAKTCSCDAAWNLSVLLPPDTQNVPRYASPEDPSRFLARRRWQRAVSLVQRVTTERASEALEERMREWSDNLHRLAETDEKVAVFLQLQMVNVTTNFPPGEPKWLDDNVSYVSCLIHSRVFFFSKKKHPHPTGGSTPRWALRSSDMILSLRKPSLSLVRSSIKHFGVWSQHARRLNFLLFVVQ